MASMLRSGSDLSEGQIYAVGLAKAGFPIPSGTGGCVWDVGANDGVWNSNSHYLLHERGFHGWLFEPDAATFLQLRAMYGRVDRGRAAAGTSTSGKVRLFNFALGKSTGVQTLRTFPIGFENTMVKAKSNQFDEQEFEYSIAVSHAKLACEQQREAVARGLCDVHGEGGPATYTVLSIDTEGLDAEVFAATHSTGCTWDVVILETPGPIAKVEASGYKFAFKEAYNHIFVRQPRT